MDAYWGVQWGIGSGREYLKRGVSADKLWFSCKLKRRHEKKDIRDSGFLLFES